MPARYCPGPTTNNIEVPLSFGSLRPLDIRPRQVPSGPDRSPSRIEEMFPCRAARDDRFPAGGQVAQQPSVARMLTRASV